MDISILVPCYNEVENITHLRESLLTGIQPLIEDYNIEIVFIDDGSTDETWATLHHFFQDQRGHHLSIKFCQHELNKGLGAAIQTGVQACEGEIIITTDSDGTYDFNTIPDLVEELGDNVDIVSASPYHPKGRVAGVPLYRLVLSRGSSFIYRMLVDWNVYTYTSLFRAYRREVFRKVKFTSRDYIAGTEILVRAYLLGFHILEFPTVLNVRQYGVSKARILSTIWSHLHFQFRILAHHLGIRSLVNKEN